MDGLTPNNSNTVIPSWLRGQFILSTPEITQKYDKDFSGIFFAQTDLNNSICRYTLESNNPQNKFKYNTLLGYISDSDNTFSLSDLGNSTNFMPLTTDENENIFKGSFFAHDLTIQDSENHILNTKLFENSERKLFSMDLTSEDASLKYQQKVEYSDNQNIETQSLTATKRFSNGLWGLCMNQTQTDNSPSLDENNLELYVTLHDGQGVLPQGNFFSGTMRVRNGEITGGKINFGANLELDENSHIWTRGYFENVDNIKHTNLVLGLQHDNSENNTSFSAGVAYTSVKDKKSSTSTRKGTFKMLLEGTYPQGQVTLKVGEKDGNLGTIYRF